MSIHKILALIFICISMFDPKTEAATTLHLKSFKEVALQHSDLENRRKTLVKELKKLKQNLLHAEQIGEETSCANQIAIETAWLLKSTTQLERAERRLNELKVELDKDQSSRLPDEQSPEDGSWGQCYQEWFFKLSLSGDQIIELARKGMTPIYKPTFLDRINEPDKIQNYLQANLIVTNPELEKSQRRELNESISALVRLTKWKIPSTYQYHPNLYATLLDFINNTWQDETTGYWGMFYPEENHSYRRSTDLSLTFHLASYLEESVKHLDRIFRTTLAIRNNNYPQGWLEDQHYENHHNYDVIRLFRLSWHLISTEEKNQARTEIKKMLNWCLTESLNPDGSFQLTPASDSLEDAYYFGVSFLAEIGFWNPKFRFWTNEELPPSQEIGEKLINKMRELGGVGGRSGVYYQMAIDKINQTKILYD